MYLVTSNIVIKCKRQFEVLVITFKAACGSESLSLSLSRTVYIPHHHWHLPIGYDLKEGISSGPIHLSQCFSEPQQHQDVWLTALRIPPISIKFYLQGLRQIFMVTIPLLYSNFLVIQLVPTLLAFPKVIRTRFFS